VVLVLIPAKAMTRGGVGFGHENNVYEEMGSNR
jgi:hypothetical protein